MENNLRNYVDELFAETTITRKSVELKEEMIQNLQDKYNDLISEGKTPEAAYNIAIAGIGDVTGLLNELENEAISPESGTAESEAARQKSAMLTAIAVMMYILSVLPLIILNQVGAYNSDIIGITILFVMVAAATGLLIYNNMTKPREINNSETMVEEFREWQTASHDRKKLRSAISAALWAVIVALYFIISFTTWAWYITWIIFIIGAAMEAFINIFFALKNK